MIIMNDLVKKLSAGPGPVIVNRRRPTAQALQERIRLMNVPILFEETETEIGIYLDKGNCDLARGDFANGRGVVHLEGVVTLNDVKVRCIADIDLGDLRGKGRLDCVEEQTYRHIIDKTNNI
jgi:hypothetical protein